MSDSRQYKRLRNTDLFIPDERCEDGKTMLEWLECANTCLPDYTADVNHAAIHTDRCRRIRERIIKGSKQRDSKPKFAFRTPSGAEMSRRFNALAGTRLIQTQIQ